MKTIKILFAIFFFTCLALFAQDNSSGKIQKPLKKEIFEHYARSYPLSYPKLQAIHEVMEPILGHEGALAWILEGKGTPSRSIRPKVLQMFINLLRNYLENNALIAEVFHKNSSINLMRVLSATEGIITHQDFLTLKLKELRRYLLHLEETKGPQGRKYIADKLKNTDKIHSLMIEAFKYSDILNETGALIQRWKPKTEGAGVLIDFIEKELGQDFLDKKYFENTNNIFSPYKDDTWREFIQKYVLWSKEEAEAFIEFLKNNITGTQKEKKEILSRLLFPNGRTVFINRYDVLTQWIDFWDRQFGNGWSWNRISKHKNWSGFNEHTSIFHAQESLNWFGFHLRQLYPQKERESVETYNGRIGKALGEWVATSPGVFSHINIGPLQELLAVLTREHSGVGPFLQPEDVADFVRNKVSLAHFRIMGESNTAKSSGDDSENFIYDRVRIVRVYLNQNGAEGIDFMKRGEFKRFTHKAFLAAGLDKNGSTRKRKSSAFDEHLNTHVGWPSRNDLLPEQLQENAKEDVKVFFLERHLQYEQHVGNRVSLETLEQFEGLIEGKNYSTSRLHHFNRTIELLDIFLGEYEVTRRILLDSDYWESLFAISNPAQLYRSWMQLNTNVFNGRLHFYLDRKDTLLRLLRQNEADAFLQGHAELETRTRQRRGGNPSASSELQILEEENRELTKTTLERLGLGVNCAGQVRPLLQP